VHLFSYYILYKQLLWIVLVGLTFALIIQSRSANLGVATGFPSVLYSKTCMFISNNSMPKKKNDIY
jgi:hypothetical protein